MSKIVLTDDETTKCWELAQDVYVDSRLHNRIINNILDPIITDFHGFLGEYAFAKYIKADYNWLKNYDPIAHDVGIYEIRTTQHANGKLITYKNDKPAPYVLMTLDMTFDCTLHLRGWAMLDECNIDEHWNTSAKIPSYWTPQHKLHNMADLPMAGV